jgi:hypothetical protein
MPCEGHGLPARGDGTVEIPLHPVHRGQHGQHLYQLSPIAELPGQGLGLAQHGEAPPMFSHWEQHISIVGLASPAVLALRAVVDEEQDAGGW